LSKKAKLKKGYLIIVLVLFVSNSTIVSGQLKIGIGAGVHTAGFRTFADQFEPPGSVILPFLGVSLSHPLSEKASLSLEGEFVTGNYFHDRFEENDRGFRELHYSLLHTSVLFRYKLGKKISVGSGVLFYYLGPTTYRFSVFPIDQSNFVTERSFDSSVSYGIPISFGYQFKKFFLDLQWNFGFMSREITSYGKIQTLSLGLFYQFEINKP